MSITGSPAGTALRAIALLTTLLTALADLITLLVTLPVTWLLARRLLTALLILPLLAALLILPLLAAALLIRLIPFIHFGITILSHYSTSLVANFTGPETPGCQLIST